MILVTHAVAGAAVACLIPSHPVLGFLLAFGSHFPLDTIPHWHYSLSNSEKNRQNMLRLQMSREVIYNFSKISTDGLLGLVVPIGLFFELGFPLWLILLGAIGGMLPDALQFVYFKWKPKSLDALQRFHENIHTKYFLDKKNFIGIGSQVMLIGAIYVLVKSLM